MTQGQLHRLAAFTRDPAGGNPAGVWVGDILPDAVTMQRIAAEVGFSETAFLSPASGKERVTRYYSPEAEVSFCGHATIAAGVLLGETDGDARYTLSTAVGEVPVDVRTRRGIREASLTSVEPRHENADPALIDRALSALRWLRSDIDPLITPVKAYAGAWHLVIAVESKGRLDALDYDFDVLKALMLQEELTTLQLVFRGSDTVFHSRNPFPVGGVVEDPATGAAAAALGGYLRDGGMISTPNTILIHQGVAMGRPSLLQVDIPESGGILVTGSAVRI